jgi:uncharacterized protein YhaN
MFSNPNIANTSFRDLLLLLDLIRDPEKFREQAALIEKKDKALADRERALQDNTAEADRLRKQDAELQEWAEKLEKQRVELEGAATAQLADKEKLGSEWAAFEEHKKAFAKDEAARLAEWATKSRDVERRDGALNTFNGKLDRREQALDAREKALDDKMAALKAAGVSFG